ncbi:MAG: SDR family NAD(P)-dependent oxidoreductase, partial [Gammaproteobacteria bacterium]
MKQAPAYVPGHELLAGKSVLITAAAGAGIGFAAAKRCVEEGCRAILVSDIHEGRTQKTVEALKALGRTQAIFGRVANVTAEEEVQALVGEAEERMDGVDVLINNAGLGGTKALVDMTDEEWHRVIDITLTGTMRMSRAMLRCMLPRKRGVIVNNASVLGWRAQPDQCHYAAAKAGVMALTRCSAMEAAPHGVRINAVSPS